MKTYVGEIGASSIHFSFDPSIVNEEKAIYDNKE